MIDSTSHVSTSIYFSGVCKFTDIRRDQMMIRLGRACGFDMSNFSGRNSVMYNNMMRERELVRRFTRKNLGLF